MFSTIFPSIGIENYEYILNKNNIIFLIIYRHCKLWLFVWHNRHGIRQLRSGWADGPAYITQCPIQTGQSYIYNFTIVGQRGTLWWHAHISWLRSTLYGPIIILPKRGIPYPFAKPYKEVPIVFGNYNLKINIFGICQFCLFGNKTYHLNSNAWIAGEWFKSDTEAIINQALQTGGGPNVSDAYTFNGLPGPLYNCSAKGIKLHQCYTKTFSNYFSNVILIIGFNLHKLVWTDRCIQAEGEVWKNLPSPISQFCTQWWPLLQYSKSHPHSCRSGCCLCQTFWDRNASHYPRANNQCSSGNQTSLPKRHIFHDC